MFSFTNIDELWSFALQLIFDTNSAHQSRAGLTLEIIGQSFILKSINYTMLQNKRRNLSKQYACAELLWYLSGTNDITMLKYYAPQYENFADNGQAYGAYGPRFMPQLPKLIDLLKHDPKTRQAVVGLWEPRDLGVIAKDIPCTVGWQFMIRDNKLHMIVFMRSNDIWLGMPYDIFVNTCIQRLIADELGIETGSYTHHTGSLHLYERNIRAAKDAIRIQANPEPNIWRSSRYGFQRIPFIVKMEEDWRLHSLTPVPNNDHLMTMLTDVLLVCCNMEPYSRSLRSAYHRGS